MKSPLSFIILWQLDEITGFSVLRDLEPAIKSSQAAQIKEPILTFNFPDQVSLGENINLELTIKNPNHQSIILGVTMSEHKDLLWNGKTKVSYPIDSMVRRK